MSYRLLSYGTPTGAHAGLLVNDTHVVDLRAAIEAYGGPKPSFSGVSVRETLDAWDDAKKLLEQVRKGERGSFAVPYLPSDAYARLDQMSIEEIAAAHEAIPAGVLARQRSSVYSPPHVPDLIGIKDRRYLDATGLVRHRDIEPGIFQSGGDQLTDETVIFHVEYRLCGEHLTANP